MNGDVIFSILNNNYVYLIIRSLQATDTETYLLHDDSFFLYFLFSIRGEDTVVYT